MDEKLHAENLAYIEAPNVRAAYRFLVEAAARSGLRTSVLRTSATRPVRMYGFAEGKEHYLFSCDRNRRDLRFYLRKPALRRWPALAREAAERFAAVRANNAGETIIHLSDTGEARRLAEWLFGEVRRFS